MKTVDPKVFLLAFDWLADEGRRHPPEAEVDELAQAIQAAIEEWEEGA